MLKHDFKINQKYSRKEISEKLGGNPMVSVATKNNKILYMCVNPKLNPSFKITDHYKYDLQKDERAYLAGSGDGIQRNAMTIIQEQECFPVFLKNEELGKWGYIGLFKYSSHTTDWKKIIHYTKESEKKSKHIDMVVIIKNVDESSTEWYPNKKAA